MFGGVKLRKLVHSPLSQARNLTLGMDRVEYHAFAAAQEALGTWEREALRYIVHDWLTREGYLSDDMYASLEDDPVTDGRYRPIHPGKGDDPVVHPPRKRSGTRR